jgi:hypothetical protein
MDNSEGFYGKCSISEDTLAGSVDIDGDLFLMVYQNGEGVGSVVFTPEQARALRDWLSKEFPDGN